MRKIIAIVVLLLTGCVSPYHIGVNQYNEGRVFCRPLNKETAEAAKAFEYKIINLITDNKFDELRKHFTNKFSENLSDKEWTRVQNIVKEYEFNGVFEPGDFTGKSISLDEASKWDGFKAFHFISSIYRLKGKQDANLILSFKKYDTALKLVGLHLFHTDPKQQNEKNSLMFRYLDHLETEKSVPLPCGFVYP